MQNAFLMFFHLMAASVAIGSSLYSIFILLPVLGKSENQHRPIEDSLELKVMDRLAPVVLSCVFILIITGVYFLLVNYTDQVNLKPGYYNLFGLKILFVIAALGLCLYQTFSLRPKVLDLDLSPDNKKQIIHTLQSMQMVGKVNLWLISIASFFGVFLNQF